MRVFNWVSILGIPILGLCVPAVVFADASWQGLPVVLGSTRGLVILSPDNMASGYGSFITFDVLKDSNSILYSYLKTWYESGRVQDYLKVYMGQNISNYHIDPFAGGPLGMFDFVSFSHSLVDAMLPELQSVGFDTSYIWLYYIPSWGVSRSGDNSFSCVAVHFLSQEVSRRRYCMRYSGMRFSYFYGLYYLDMAGITMITTVGSCTYFSIEVNNTGNFYLYYKSSGSPLEQILSASLSGSQLSNSTTCYDVILGSTEIPLCGYGGSCGRLRRFGVGYGFCPGVSVPYLIHDYHGDKFSQVHYILSSRRSGIESVIGKDLLTYDYSNYVFHIYHRRWNGVFRYDFLLPFDFSDFCFSYGNRKASSIYITYYGSHETAYSSIALFCGTDDAPPAGALITSVTDESLSEVVDRLKSELSALREISQDSRDILQAVDEVENLLEEIRDKTPENQGSDEQVLVALSSVVDKLNFLNLSIQGFRGDMGSLISQNTAVENQAVGVLSDIRGLLAQFMSTPSPPENTAQPWELLPDGGQVESGMNSFVQAFSEPVLGTVDDVLAAFTGVQGEMGFSVPIPRAGGADVSFSWDWHYISLVTGPVGMVTTVIRAFVNLFLLALSFRYSLKVFMEALN